jgi:hypothetical protein
MTSVPLIWLGEGAIAIENWAAGLFLKAISLNPSRQFMLMFVRYEFKLHSSHDSRLCTKPRIIVLLPGYGIPHDGPGQCQSAHTKAGHRGNVGTADRLHSSCHRQSQIHLSRCRSRSVALATCDNLALIILLDLEPDFGLIEGVASLGKLFFAVSVLSNCYLTLAQP